MNHKIDEYSYNCGVIDAFNEMVGANVKQLALSHAFTSKEERDTYISKSIEICLQYHTHYYIEDELLICDLFPVSWCKNKYVILFYKDKNVFDSYLSLKKKKQEALTNKMYDDLRYEIAHEFGSLLSYTKEEIDRFIEINDDKE